jgi:dihydrofolate reductase
MTQNIYYVASSLDGFIADADNGIDWLLGFGFESFQEHYDDFLAGVGAIVMGSATYDFMLGESAVSPWPYAGLPTWVVTSRELPSIDGANISFVRGPVADFDARVRESAGDRDVWIVGGGDLAAQYADAGLLDRLLVTVMPIVLGSGVPLLPVASHTGVLTLESTTRFAPGAVGLDYTVARPSVAADDGGASGTVSSGTGATGTVSTGTGSNGTGATGTGSNGS